MVFVALVSILCILFFWKCRGDHRDLHVLTHSCPTRRSSDLAREQRSDEEMDRAIRQIVSRALVAGEVVDVYAAAGRSEEHTSELQSLMRISYAVFCLKKKKAKYNATPTLR